MRHRVSGRKLNRTMEHRKALLRNLVTSLIVEERLETTLPRAKELRRVADRMVTLGKRGSLHARRRALSYIRSNEAVQKLFSELAKRYADRNGGYTRVIKMGQRQGDSADMALIEYIGAPLKPSREERRKLRAEERKAKEAAEQKIKKTKKSSKAKKSTQKAKAAGKKARSVTETVTEKTKEKGQAKPAPKAEKKPTTATQTKKRGMLGRMLGRRSKGK